MEQDALEKLLRVVRERGVGIIESPFLFRRIDPRHDVKALIHLVSLLRRLAPHGLHTHTSKAGLIGRLAGRIAGVPWIVHTPHGHVFWGHFPPLLSRIFLQIERLARPMTDHLIALTSGEAEDYVRLSVMNAEKISIIPSGIVLDPFYEARLRHETKRRKTESNQKTIVVGFVGWLWPVKGVRFLMEAMIDIMRENPRVFLSLVGRGDEERHLRERAAEAHLEHRVVFHGWRSDIHEIMPGFDVLVLPSLNEGMGRVLVEAMAAGVPIVASNVGGIPDLVKHGENGLLVPPADVAALREAVRTLIDDPPLRERMGRKGRNMCHRFDIKSMVNKISEVYETLQAQIR